jgi:fucose transport system permease protein
MMITGVGSLWSRVATTLGRATRLVLLLFVLVTSLAPFAWVALSSLKTNVEVIDSPLGLPQHPSLNGYVNALTLAPFGLFLRNSLFVAVGATALAIAVFGLAAYVLARYRFRGNRIIYAVIVSTLLIPLIPLQQSITVVIRTIGLYDSLWALVLVHGTSGLPVTVFILYSYFKTIPRDVLEAAELDGAGMFQTYFRVAIPLARPALAAAAVLVFLGSWNDFLFPLLLTQSESTRTLSYALRFFQTTFAQDYQTLFAAVVLAMVPSVVVYVLLQEQIQKSLVGGAVRQ